MDKRGLSSSNGFWKYHILTPLRKEAIDISGIDQTEAKLERTEININTADKGSYISHRGKDDAGGQTTYH